MRQLLSCKIEAKNIYDTVKENEGYMFEYLFEDAYTPDGISYEEYYEEVKREYSKFKKEEAERLLGLKN